MSSIKFYLISLLQSYTLINNVVNHRVWCNLRNKTILVSCIYCIFVVPIKHKLMQLFMLNVLELKTSCQNSNCKAQWKVEKEKYITIVYVFICVNEHDSVAKVVLKMEELVVIFISLSLSSPFCPPPLFFSSSLLRQKIIRPKGWGNIILLLKILILSSTK